ncbi:hypothetical protein SDC9_170638 [bioreactor metagenome]|uniref:Uncharacterized protein n=1 Tax=bioreactor metagenome TaxID=1076179 RepID=A0A645GB36_9ZZZZ
MPLAHGAVVKGGVGVCSGGGKSPRPAEQVVILIDIIVKNLAGASQLFHGPLRGAGL